MFSKIEHFQPVKTLHELWLAVATLQPPAEIVLAECVPADLENKKLVITSLLGAFIRLR